MSDDYGYINARLRGMKGRLLRRSDLEGLLAMETVEDIISFMDTTPYAPHVELALTLKKGVGGLDEGLRRDLEKTFDRIVTMASDRPKELIHILMGRWELLNVKTILRGKHVNATLETVLGNLIPFGRLDDVALKELANQKDIKGIIDLLVQWRLPYAQDLKKAFPRYREKEDLQYLEHALDKAYFDGVFKRLDPGDPDDAQVLAVTSREIDIILIGYAARIVHHGLKEADPSETFIRGGKYVDMARFQRLLGARSMDELIRVLEVPCYSECLEKGMTRYLENRRLSAMERAMETCFIRNTCQAVHLDPLSIAVVVGYLWLKVNEVVNLRIIARGVNTAMPREEIEKYLVLMA